ncbi:hypothetical protein [Stutzerimonas xanthomarina]|uniref:hypothetical protein n=1 Tax=Stutzerimonas xanthomarina TaxID=271420 RepID=UPI003AA9C5DB
MLDPLDIVDGIEAGRAAAKAHQRHDAKLAEKIAKQTAPNSPTVSPAGTDALRFTFCSLASTGAT